MAFLYVPNGIVMEDWTPAGGLGATPLGELPRISSALTPYRNDLMMLTRPHVGRRAARTATAGGDHGRAGAAYLTGVHPKKTYGKDIKAGVSMDQIAARHLEGQTRFASLELGCEEGIQGGNCDNGYSCAYSNSLSWRTENTPNPPEIRPRAVFERLFGVADDEKDPARRQRIGSYRREHPGSRHWPKRRASRPRLAATTSASSTNTCTPFATSRSAFRAPSASHVARAPDRRAVGQRAGRFRRTLSV